MEIYQRLSNNKILIKIVLVIIITVAMIIKTNDKYMYIVYIITNININKICI